MITIIATISITLAVIILGLGAWELVKLSRKSKEIDGLRSDLEHSISDVHRIIDENMTGVHRNFDDSNRDRDENNKEIKNEIHSLEISIRRDLESQIIAIGRELEELHRRMVGKDSELERQLDKRFDAVYRKMKYQNKD